MSGRNGISGWIPIGSQSIRQFVEREFAGSIGICDHHIGTGTVNDTNSTPLRRAALGAGIVPSIRGAGQVPFIFPVGLAVSCSQFV